MGKRAQRKHNTKQEAKLARKVARVTTAWQREHSINQTIGTWDEWASIAGRGALSSSSAQGTAIHEHIEDCINKEKRT